MRSSILMISLAGLLAGPSCTSTAPPPAPPAQTDPSVRPSAPPPTPSSACASIPATTTYSRAVEGHHRACTEDDQCRTVRLDCSNVNCTAVAREHAATYGTPIDCEGYDGPMANYDCRPEFDIEAPRCVDGCCVSERIVPLP